MTARLSYLSCEISVGAAALCIRRLGDSIVVRASIAQACEHTVVRLDIYVLLQALRNSPSTIWRFIVLALCETNERIALKVLTSRDSFLVLVRRWATKFIAIPRQICRMTFPWKSIRK